jgi:acyl-CoA thioesterase-1
MLVLELGGNDGLRGIDLDDTYQNLLTIVNQTREAYPDVAVVIAGMQVPPNLGPDYTRAFADLFPRLSQETGATLIPFLLEGVGGDPSLNLPDGIHPTEAGHQIVAETVWEVVGPILTAAMPQQPPQ